MKKEQEDAIEYFKKHINYFKEQIKFIEAVDSDYYDEEYELYKNRVKQFETILSMLKENSAEIKQKNTELAEKNAEIEKFKQVLARNIARNVTSSMKESAKSKEDLEMLNAGWQIELEKKDKIIDLITEFLGEQDLGYYKNETGGEIFGIMRKYNKEDWKQYFENKLNSSEQN